MSDGGARPDGTRNGLVRAAVAPVLAEPDVSATQVSQYVLGHRLDLLSDQGEWWRVRGEDDYEGWVHAGYLELGAGEWARTWEEGTEAEPVISLGAELRDEEERMIARLPWGARMLRDAPGRLRLPDGRAGAPAAGETIATRRLKDRFPPRGESIVRTARRWAGTPYLWGGVTPAGADCSGFLQSVFWMHGIALPRDTGQQAQVGEEVEPGNGFSELQPGDLLFFAEHSDRITHIALSLGGARVFHCSLSNGGTATNDVTGELPLEQRLKREFVRAVRLLPD